METSESDDKHVDALLEEWVGSNSSLSHGFVFYNEFPKLSRSLYESVEGPAGDKVKVLDRALEYHHELHDECGKKTADTFYRELPGEICEAKSCETLDDYLAEVRRVFRGVRDLTLLEKGKEYVENHHFNGKRYR